MGGRMGFPLDLQLRGRWADTAVPCSLQVLHHYMPKKLGFNVTIILMIIRKKELTDVYLKFSHFQDKLRLKCLELTIYTGHGSFNGKYKF